MARTTARVPASLRDVLQRGACERAHGVEGEVAPELDPDVRADVGPHRRLEAGSDEGPAQCLHALATGAVRLAEGQALLAQMGGDLDHAGLDDLARRENDAADGPLRPDQVPLGAVGVDRSDAPALVGALQLVKIPPGDAVGGRDHGRLRPEQRLQALADPRHGMGLEGDDDGVLRAEFRRIVGRPDLRPALLPAGAHAHAVGLHRREMGPARDQRHFRAAKRKLEAEIGADRAGADDADLHVTPSERLRPSSGRDWPRTGTPGRRTPRSRFLLREDSR